MLHIGPEPAAAAAAAPESLWFPGKNAPPAGASGHLSERAQEIARKREELLGMLCDLPESEYELSLTDLVEQAGGGGAADAAKGASPASRDAPSRRREQAAGRDRRRRASSSSSFRSSSDGVLLNFYMPSSLTRSSTTPRPSRPPHARRSRAPADCTERDRDAESVKCWPSLRDLRWRTSRRQTSKAPQCPASAAILKSANYSTP